MNFDEEDDDVIFLLLVGSDVTNLLNNSSIIKTTVSVGLDLWFNTGQQKVFIAMYFRN